MGTLRRRSPIICRHRPLISTYVQRSLGFSPSLPTKLFAHVKYLPVFSFYPSRILPSPTVCSPTRNPSLSAISEVVNPSCASANFRSLREPIIVTQIRRLSFLSLPLPCLSGLRPRQEGGRKKRKGALTVADTGQSMNPQTRTGTRLARLQCYGMDPSADWKTSQSRVHQPQPRLAHTLTSPGNL